MHTGNNPNDNLIAFSHHHHHFTTSRQPSSPGDTYLLVFEVNSSCLFVELVVNYYGSKADWASSHHELRALVPEDKDVTIFLFSTKFNLSQNFQSI